MSSSVGGRPNIITGNETQIKLEAIPEQTPEVTMQPLDARDRGDEDLEKVARYGNLKFDMEEPWQRSLVKELGRMESTRTNNIQRPKNDRVLLRHTSSRDHAMKCEVDDATVTSDASSTVPVKAQVIHRFNHFVTADTRETSNRTPVFANSSLERTAEDPNSKKSPDLLSDKKKQSRAIPAHLPVSNSSSLVRKNNFQADRPYLEMEIEHDSVQLPDPSTQSCMCLGYNLLDFLLEQPIESQTQSHRKPYVRPTLATVDETREETISHYVERDSFLSRQPIEPTGTYNDKDFYLGTNLQGTI